VLLASALAAPAVAQDPPPTNAAVEGLRQENQELTSRVESLEDLVFGQDSQEEHLGLVASYGDVLATFQIYGDTGVRSDSPSGAGMGNTSFAFGAVDFFATASLGERFQVLSETAISASGQDTKLSQERLWGAWTFGDELYAKLGVEHNSLSRWNRTSHHGAWLEPTIERPMLSRFEGEGGLLPLHNSGLELGGQLETSLGRLNYTAALSNGRGETPTNKQRNFDANDGKAMDFSLSFAPECWQALQVGSAVRYDSLPANMASPIPARGLSMRQFIVSAFAEYQEGGLQLLSEFAYISDEARLNGANFPHNTGYLQAGYTVGDVTPYLRVDYRDMRMGDPFYSPFDRDLNAWIQTTGVRFELAPNAALKLEVNMGNEQLRGAGGVTRGDFVSVAAQLAFVI